MERIEEEKARECGNGATITIPLGAYSKMIIDIREREKKICNLLAALAERDKRIELLTLTESEKEHLLRQLKYNQDKAEQAEADIVNARKVLWTSHGHESLYGDDGEMQCAECMPHYDYKNEPLHHLIANVLRNAREQAEARVRELEKYSKREIKEEYVSKLESRLSIAREGLEEIDELTRHSIAAIKINDVAKQTLERME